MNMRLSGAFAALALLVTAVGCAPPPPYLGGYRFAPEPSMAVMFKPGSQTPALTSMVSVIGVRRGDRDKRIPPAVEIRLRLENNGQEAASFDPATLSLVTGSLQSLGPAEVHPAQALQIAPGQMQMVSSFFPFPPGMSPESLPLNALRLRWQVTLDGKPYLQTVVFERTYPLYYDGP